MSLVEVFTPDHEDVFESVKTEKQMQEPNLDRMIRRTSFTLEGVLKEFTPVRTALTRASITTKQEGNLTYGVGSWTRGDILRFLDRGTGIYRTGKMIVITPKARRALRFISKESGDVVFAAYVLQRGIVPMEIFTRAIQTVLPRMSMEE